MDNKAMYRLSYGLFVLTAKGAKDNGCIINTAMQITTNPNRMIVTVNKENLTHDMVKETKEFNVSVLSVSAAMDVFKHFGYQSGKTEDKFADYPDCARAENGILYITKGTNAYISGKVIDMVDCGTHTIFLADVTDAVILNEEESVTYDYYQKHIKEQPKEEKKSGWRCRICGYIYEGEDLPADFICPICKHGAEDFEKI